MSQKEVDQAFPLIRTICPEADLERWRHFAAGRLTQGAGSGAGILMVRNEQDCIVAIATFLLSQDLVHGPILLADYFGALDIFDQDNVARSLEAGLEKIARRHGCAAVHTSLAGNRRKGDDDWLCSVLFERGHHVEGLHMCKLLPVST